MRIRLQTLLIVLLVSIGASAVSYSNIRWHNESADKAKIAAILRAARQKVKGSNASDYVPVIARQLVGTPYVAHTLESTDGKEWLTINMEQLDCTTFVETVMALAQTAAAPGGDWQVFADNLERIRYRGGRLDDYASRLHYICEWVLDNSSLGIVADVAPSLNPDYTTKTINFMSTHRDSYPALKSEKAIKRIRDVEARFVNHRFPYINKARLGAIKGLKEGDIIALTTSIDGLDVTHMGFVTYIDGKPHLLHASSTGKKVMVDSRTLSDYTARSKSCTGIRVLRLR